MRAWLLVCAAGCGRIGFDPIGEPFAYSTTRPLYLYNDVAPAKTIPIEDNAPISSAGLADFTITPDLKANTGLTFDPLTGVISGRPTRTSPPTVYTVTATTSDLVSTARVTIRTAPGFYVTDLGDVPDSNAADDDCVIAGGGCTLRAALEQLAAFDTTPRVALVVSPGTIQLGLGELLAMRPVEIIGTGRDTTAIDAAGASRVLNFADSLDVIVSDVTLRRGNIVAGGGGCFHMQGGNVALRDLIVESCTSSGGDGGVSLDSRFDTLPLQATIERVVFRNNSAGVEGGALGLGTGVAGTTATITASEFAGNTAPRASALHLTNGPLTIAETLVADNTGGVAIYLDGGTTTRLVNDTIVGNQGGLDPGALVANNDAMVQIVNSTIVDNTCSATCFGVGGIGQNTGGMMTIRNTILARNLDLESGIVGNCHGAGVIMSLGNNLADVASECLATSTGDRFSTDLQLLPLADHGGPTRTMAITTRSIAYDGGSSADCPTTDQRGAGYPRPAARACDIGAFEAQ